MDIRSALELTPSPHQLEQVVERAVIDAQFVEMGDGVLEIVRVISGDAVAAIASVRPPPPLQPSSATPAAATGTDGKAVQEATDQETASLEDDAGEPELGHLDEPPSAESNVASLEDDSGEPEPEPDHLDEPPSVESNGANQGDTLRLFPE